MSGRLSREQRQVRDAFSFKWSRTESYSLSTDRRYREWLLQKYFDGDPLGPSKFLGHSGSRILDAGCGAGETALALFGEDLVGHAYIGVDLSDAVELAQSSMRQAGVEGEFIQADVADLPEELAELDRIFSEGVLHHTDDMEATLAHLVSRLRTGGLIAFYVYARKAPVREFTDDFVREQLRELSDETAWKELRSLTRLGVALGELGAEIDVPEDVPLLGIKAGRYDVQRLFYYSFCKAFYRDDMTLEQMLHVNFDWYRPLNCHRSSPDEVRAMCERAGLEVERLYVDESGITVIGKRQ